MPLTKTQLLNDLETLKKTPKGVQEQIAVDKSQVIELLQSFEDLSPTEVQKLINRIDDRQKVDLWTFQQIIDELIDIIGDKEELEIAQLLGSKEAEINRVIASFREKLNVLRQEIGSFKPAPVQTVESSPQAAVISAENLKKWLAQKRNDIKGKKLFGLFEVDWAFKGFEELILKEAKGEELTWREKIKKWWYTLVLGLVAGDTLREINAILATIDNPVEELKSKFWPEAIKQYKEKLWETFLNYLRPVIPANLSSEAVKEKWGNVWQNMRTKYEEVLVRAFPENGDLSNLEAGSLFTLGGMFAFDLVKNLWEEGLISLKQLGFEAVKEGSSYVFHMSIQWIHMLGGVVSVSLGKITLEDWRKLISMEWESAKAKAVWLYRLMETWIWEILKFGAKIPGYALSSMASLDEVVAKFKVFKDMWRGEGEFVLNQLKALSQSLGGWGEDLKKFGDIMRQIEESVAVYNAAKFAKTQKQFRDNLSKFLPPESVESIIAEIEKSWGDDFFKKAGNYLVWKAAEIKNIDAVVVRSWSEKLWLKWKTSDLRKSIVYLGDVVEESWKALIDKRSFWWSITSIFKKTEIAWKSMIMVDAKALSESSKDLRGALKLAMKQSPYLFSEFLGASPIFLLAWLEVQECKDEGCSPKKLLGAWLDVMMDLIPIVGPVRFLWGNRQDANNWKENIAQYAAGFGWLGLDGFYFVRSLGKKGLSKAVIDALLEPARAVGNVGRFVSRSATVWWDLLKAIGSDVKNLKFTTFRRTLSQGWEFVKTSRGWWIGVAIVSVFVGVEAYRWWQDKQKMDKFQKMVKEIQTNCENQYSQDCEQYLRERFANSKDDAEKIFITAVLIYRNFGIWPQGVEVERSENNGLKIVFNGRYNLPNPNPFVMRESSSKKTDENPLTKVYTSTPLARQIVEYVELLWWKEAYVTVRWDVINPFGGENNNIAETQPTQTSS